MSDSVHRDGKHSAGASGARLGGAANRAMTRLTPMGRAFVVMAVVLVGIGMHRRINLLMLLGDALLVIAVLNLLAAGPGLRRLQGRRRLGEWLFARTPFPVAVQVTNTSRRQLWGLRIEEDGLRGAEVPSQPADKRSEMDPQAATRFVEGMPPGARCGSSAAILLGWSSAASP
jgi:hypothetical protein